MKLQMFNINNSTSSNVVSGKFKIINTDSNSVNLSDIKIRYYYTIDSKREENFWCDYSSMNVGYNSTSITDKVTGTFYKLDTAVKGADYYLEVGFKTGAPDLPSGGTAEIQWRFAKIDWTNYDQNNDYSFNSSATELVDWDKAILLVKDTVVSGEVPTEEVIISPGDLTPKIKVEMFNINTLITSNSITPKIKVTNIGNVDINLSKLKLRYYFTSDSDKSQQFWCDHASITTGGYKAITSSVLGTFGSFTPSQKDVDSYLEISFDTNAGSLEAEGILEAQIRFAKIDWSNFDQSNDYSFNSTSSNYVQWSKITGYIDGKLLWGVEPDGSVVILDSEISPSKAIVDLNSPEDISITITLNGNTFKGIEGLIENEDFIIKENVVTLNKSYLETLEAGTVLLTFKFSAGNSKVLTLTVKPKDIPPKDILTVTIDSKEAIVGDTITIPVTISGISSKGLNANNFTLKYDKEIFENVEVEAGDICVNADLTFVYNVDAENGLIYVMYCDSTGDGLEAITTNGIFMNIKLTVKKDAKTGRTEISVEDKGVFADIDMNIYDVIFKVGTILIKEVVIPKDSLIVTIDSKEGTAGDTITIPVTISGITSKGLNANNFTLKYDKEIFENVKVEAGDICVNADLTFVYNVDAENGLIYVMYCDSTGDGLEAITTDGIFMNIKLTVKEDAKSGNTEISVEDKGVFADIDMKVYEVEFVLGVIDIKEKEIPPIDEKKLSVEMASISGEQGSKIVIPVVVSGIDKDKLNAFNFALSYDASIFEDVSVSAGEVAINPTLTFVSHIDEAAGTIYVMYCDSTGDGIEAIVSDGTIMNVQLSIKEDGEIGTTELKVSDNGVFADINSVVYTTTFKNSVITILEKEVPPIVDDKFTATIESNKGKAGDVVVVPVVLKNTPDSGIANFDFKIKYDGSILDVTSVSAGSIVTNPNVNFKYNVNTSSNLIYVTFIDFEAYGNDLIKEDGDLVNITFTIKENVTAQKTSITTSGDVNFADYDGNTLDVIFNEGSIEIS